MTSPLPRKPRTTARRTPAAGTALSLALLAALGGAGAAAPPPGAVTAAPVALGQVDPVDPKDPGPPRPAPDPPTSAQDVAKYTQLPGRDKIFLMYNDAQLERAIMNRFRESPEYQKSPATIEPSLRFPREEVVGGSPYVPKTGSYPPMRATYDALYVVHRRLHFEEKNAERYGWDLGYIQPLVSSAYFFRDVLLWPNSLASGCAYGFWDTSAGKCLPGSPTPYYLYPPGLTITGTAAEAAIITGAAFAFP